MPREGSLRDSLYLSLLVCCGDIYGGYSCFLYADPCGYPPDRSAVIAVVAANYSRSRNWIPVRLSDSVLSLKKPRSSMDRHAIPRPAIDPEDHLGWAVAIAHDVARRYAFRPRSQEEHDLEQIACLTVCSKVLKYDPLYCPVGGDHDGAFRGWCKRDVVSETAREARRIRNGGSYRTRREVRGEALVAAPFSDLDDDDGLVVIDPRPIAEREPPLTETELKPLSAQRLYGRRLARGH